MAKLTDKQKAFVTEYLVDLNATQSAIRAGYSSKRASEIAYQLLQKTTVQQAIDEAQANRAERTEITADRVVQELWNIVTVDANEIVELRRGCCRYCWGKGNQYQLTANEMIKRKEHYAAEERKAAVEGKEVEPFNPLGGIGYDATKEPNPKCPECFGQGEMSPFFHDTRCLSPAAKSLYAGVKVTKDGIEVKMHSKDKMIELLGKHLGMFKEKMELSGPNGGPIETIDKSDPAAVEARISELIRKRTGRAP